ncbi:hypothetical protein JAB5_40850 [Janthinobacterium sp. HH103]|nr:hypothetical protein JAB2_11170 [Janthinobacterium sp. HH100]OEZ71314.1 hypothetical protein JAB5_40850 [Janthinobacterium sp. HH103]QOU74275.1 hypothetical protein JAB4_037380 [Janthinobacterium sp. HH102]
MTIQPQTTCNEIRELIHTFVDKGKFLDRDSQVALEIFAEIDKLDNSNPDEGLELRAALLHICGDLNGAITALDQRTNKDLSSDLTILANYSRCEAAQALFAKCGPTTGMFWSNVMYAKPAGAFHMAASFAREAERMHLQSTKSTCTSVYSLEEIFMIDEVLDELGITDPSAGKIMEVAGRVLEQHGYMFLSAGPEIEIFGDRGEQRTINLTYRVAASSSDAINMYMDFIDGLFQRDLDMPIGFHVSFGGSNA